MNIVKRSPVVGAQNALKAIERKLFNPFGRRREGDWEDTEMQARVGMGMLEQGTREMRAKFDEAFPGCEPIPPEDLHNWPKGEEKHVRREED